MKLKGRNGIFYGWYIVLAGFIIMGVNVGIVSNCGSQFIKPIAEELGYTRAEVGMMQTIMSICYMAMSFMAGKILARDDLGKILKVDVFIVPIAYFCYSFVDSLPMLYAISVIVGASYSLLGVLSFSVIIPNWFIEKRGKAIGLSFMGSGVGGMIFNFLAGQWLGTYGWRMTYRILAVCLFVIMAPFVLFVLKTKPSEMGLEPYGADSARKDGEQTADVSRSGVAFKDAVRSPSFWLIVVGNAAMGMCTYCCMLTIAPHLSDIGYSTMFAATMVSLAMGALAIGKYSLGVLFDKVGPKWATIMSAASYVLGALGLLFGRFRPAMVLILIGAGLGCAFGSVGVPIITETVFGRREYAAIYGVLTGTSSVITAFNPTLANFVFDRTGSYDLCYVAAICLATMAGAIFTGFFTRMERAKK